jgi:hypothetical protein
MRSNLVGEGGAEASTETSDEVVAELGVMLARLGALAAQPTVGDDVDDAARIDRIALLERLRAALAAAQHTEMVAFARSQVEAHIADSEHRPGVAHRPARHPRTARGRPDH